MGTFHKEEKVISDILSSSSSEISILCMYGSVYHLYNNLSNIFIFSFATSSLQFSLIVCMRIFR